MVSTIYSNRRFFVADGGEKSAWHRQAFGISQGCPLSPFLFVILMTVLLSDAQTSLRTTMSYRMPGRFPSELVYADDTLVMATEQESAHAYMVAIAEAGRSYGLCLNWSKCEVMPVKSHGSVVSPHGGHLPVKTALGYLGSTLCSDGRISSELGRRIGKAKRELESLKRVWSHAGMKLTHKLRIFDQCVVSGLVYGLSSAVLTKADRRRLDGFQARCLRNILGIPSAYTSRISNQATLDKAKAKPLSETLRDENEKYFNELRDCDFSDPVRGSIFCQTGCGQRPFIGKRRLGRPRLTWMDSIQRT